MGLFARAAAKSEGRTMAAVEEAIETLTDLDHGSINLPCHIVTETHAGVWAGSKDDDAERWVGIYRCQFHFWGVVLSKGNIEGAQRGQDQANWLLIRKMQGDLEVSDLGRMDNGGVMTLAGALTMIDYK